MDVAAVHNSARVVQECPFIYPLVLRPGHSLRYLPLLTCPVMHGGLKRHNLLSVRLRLQGPPMLCMEEC